MYRKGTQLRFEHLGGELRKFGERGRLGSNKGRQTVKNGGVEDWGSRVPGRPGDYRGRNWSKRSQTEAVVYVGSGLAGASVSMVLGLLIKVLVRGLLGFFWLVRLLGNRPTYDQ